MSRSPTVFISYSRGSDEYMGLVRALFDRLKADGINCIDDQACPPGADWQRWTSQQIDSAAKHQFQIYLGSCLGGFGSFSKLHSFVP